MAEFRQPGDFERIRDHGRDYFVGMWRNPLTGENKIIDGDRKVPASYYDENAPSKRVSYTDDEIRTLLRGEAVIRTYTTSSGVAHENEPALLCHKVSQYGKDMYAAQPEDAAMEFLKKDQAKAKAIADAMRTASDMESRMQTQAGTEDTYGS